MSQPVTPLPPELDPFAEETGSEFDVKEYLFRILRHWRLISVVTALCLAAAGIKFFITPKAYQAKAILQIERRSLTPLVGSQNPWLENFWNMEFYPTQERLLQSRGLAEQVVRNLHLLTDPSFGGSPRAASAEASAAADEAAVSRLAQRIRRGLSVRRIRETQLVEITYRSDSGDKAAKLANGFAQAFIDMGIESRFATADQASGILTTEIETLQQEISQKEALLQDLGRRHEIVDLDPESNVTLQRLRALNQDLSEAQNQRIQKQARYRELLAAPAENVADSYSNGEIGQLRANAVRLEQEYNSQLAVYKPDFPQMVDLKARVNTARKALADAVRENATKAREAARTEYQAAERQERTLAQEIEALKGQSIDQKSSRLEFLNLEDEVETRRQLLTQLRQRQSETEATVRLRETRASNVRVIDTALVPGGPYRPSLRRNISLGLLLGLGIGVGLSMLREFLDRTIKSGEELESLLRLPTLAVIPDIFDNGRPYGYGSYGYGYGYGYGAQPSGQERRSRRWLEKRKKDEPAQIELLPHERPRLAVAEAYRSLRTALLLSSANELRVIAVTSAVAGEGKTATASNLAVVMAQLGKSVLIVDADLRKPRQHQLFRVSNRLGLVNYLTGTADLATIIAPTHVPNLSLCPSGPSPPNPSELLSSARMKELLEVLLQHYDFVVVDTPPTLAVTDSTLVGSITDGVVLCCRAGRLQRDEAKDCRDRLRFAEVKTLGTVLNGYRPTGGSSSYGRKNRYYQSYEAEELSPPSQAYSAA